MTEPDPDFMTLVAQNLEGAAKHDCSDDWLIENRHEIARRLVDTHARLTRDVSYAETDAALAAVPKPETPQATWLDIPLYVALLVKHVLRARQETKP